MYHLNVKQKNIVVDTLQQDIIVKRTDGKAVVVGNHFSIYDEDTDLLKVNELHVKSMGVLEDRTLIDFGVRFNNRMARQKNMICLYLPDGFCSHLRLISHSGNISVYGVRLDCCDIESQMGIVQISSI